MPLADVTELLVLQDDPRVLRFHSFSVNSLAAGQILIKIDKFGLTANNISYIATGKSLRYFDFFPADDKHYGKMNVWGFGTVTASNHAEVKTGERLWGYFPFASHLLCTPGTVSSTQIVLSRPDLPKDRLVYLTYTRLNNPAADPLPVPKELEDHAMLFRGLWATGFLLADHLVQKNYLGATSKRVLISSASSKTGYGLAFCIKALDPSSTTVGLTSKRNVDFVRSLGLYDDIVAYDEIKNELKVRDGVMVDMAGDGSVNKSVFDRLGSSNLKGHVRVGAVSLPSAALM